MSDHLSFYTHFFLARKVNNTHRRIQDLVKGGPERATVRWVWGLPPRKFLNFRRSNINVELFLSHMYNNLTLFTFLLFHYWAEENTVDITPQIKL